MNLDHRFGCVKVSEMKDKPRQLEPQLHIQPNGNLPARPIDGGAVLA